MTVWEVYIKEQKEKHVVQNYEYKVPVTLRTHRIISVIIKSLVFVTVYDLLISV